MTAVPPRWPGGTRLALSMLAIGIAHTVLRGDPWAYEWRWASFQYHLVTLLAAPVVAAEACWEGVVLRRAGDPVVAAGRTIAFAGRACGRLLGWIALGYVAGSFVVVGQVWRARGVELPPLDATAMFVPALLQLAAVAAASFWLGWTTRSALVVPVVAFGWFAVLIGAHVALPDEVVRVGGATSSLLGLHVPVRTQVFQAWVAGAVVVLAALALWVAERRGTEADRRMGVPVASALVVAVAGGALFSPSPEFFRVEPVREVCRGRSPQLCVAPEYLPVVARVEAQLAPALAEVRSVGAPVPVAMHQDPSRYGVLADVIRDGEVHVPYAVVDAWLPLECPALEDGDSIVNESRFAWGRYLRERLAGERLPADGAEVAHLQAQAERILACDDA